ncbi:hypothetical protein D9757_000282 [Collybiopsis confluens]|uniref:DNA replication checkpoint mediator MRC1 domain-containing protein n=1 Tax=Collybiopsis confluens TaxID=2823264 RepID=A0A8H5I2T1_9AGAR|nr:hypothetical protein D9757_000282 [Collybiopsis confluens]
MVTRRACDRDHIVYSFLSFPRPGSPTSLVNPALRITLTYWAMDLPLSSSSTSHIKRPKRTYGRPKPVADQGSVSTSSLLPADFSYTRTSENGPRNNSPALKPSNSFPAVTPEHDPGNDDVEGSGHASTKFEWSWKTRMKQIDENEHKEEGVLPLERVTPLLGISEQPTQQNPLSPEQSLHKELPSSTSPVLDFQLSPSRDVFSEFPTALSLEPSQKTLAGSPSPSPKSTFRKRASKPQRIVESDVESDQEKNSKSSYPSSPIKHAINTPQTRSSTTPPTSDDENKMATAKRKPRPKGRSTPNPLEFEPVVDLDRPKASNKKKTQSNKVKPPTKKEVEETKKERHRLLAEKKHSIPRTTREPKLTVSSLLHFVAASSSKKSPLKGEDSMDPISEFSSPHATKIAHSHDSKDGEGVDPDINRDFPLALAADSNDESLPDMDRVLQEDKASRLKALKLFHVQQQQQKPGSSKPDNDDDDLKILDGPNVSIQVAVKEEAEARKSGRSSITTSERIVQKHAGKSTLRRPSGEVKSASEAQTQGQLNGYLLKRAREDDARRSKEKNDEWVRRGGRLTEAEAQISTEEKRDLAWHASKGLERSMQMKAESETKERGGFEDEANDPDDEEWTPDLRGSVSPAPGDEEEVGQGEADQDITMVDENGTEEEEEEEEGPSQPGAPFRRANRAVIIESDTEDENDENARPEPQRTFGKVLVADSMILETPKPQQPHLQSDSSYEGTEDECDKENDGHLMYDRSEDKENTAVVRHAAVSQSGGPRIRPALEVRQRSPFNLDEGLASRLSMSPDLAGHSTGDDENEKLRVPLTPIMTGIELFVPPAVPFSARLQRANSDASVGTGPHETPLPAFALRKRQVSTFSSFSDDGEGVQTQKLQAGFSEFLDADSQKPSSSHSTFRALREPAQTNSFFAKLRRNDTLGLTQDIGLQPALEVDNNLKLQADQVFEKEQEFLLDAANKSTSKEPEVYINDQGFLTQTRPDGKAEIYRPNPTQSQLASQFPSTLANPSPSQVVATQRSTARTPLSELSRASRKTGWDIDDTPEPSTRLRRLTKHRSLSPLDSVSPSDQENRVSIPSLLSSPSNMFSKKARRVDRPRIDKPRRKLEKSEFIEGEAQESDEDEAFGFSKLREEDGEDGEDQDRTLETLVDDKAMDQTEIAEAKVLEKYQEHLQVDDARDEELARMAVDGHLRHGKRRRGRAGIDDSDDDDEEDERNRRIRRKMKEPELRENMKAMAANESTKAFADQYQAIHKNEDPEFDYLRGGDDFDMSGVTFVNEEGVRAEEDIEEEDNDDGFISRSELVQRVRDLAQDPEVEEQTLDPNDTSFVDQDIYDNDEDLPPVRMAQLHRNPRGGGSGNGGRWAEQFDEDASQSYTSESMVGEHNRGKVQQYVQNEGRRSKQASGSRTGAGASVTRNYIKTSEKVGVASRSRNDPLNGKIPQPVKPARSMLGLMDRKDRFQ